MFRVLLIALMIGISAPAIAQDVGTFTGGDVGEGLDVRGRFLHAVNVLGPDAGSVGDAVFLSETNATDVTIIATRTQPSWANPEYGGSANDNTLETVMSTIRWSAVSDNPRTVTINAGGLIPGEFYQLQLLFTESCCNRAFAIAVEDSTILEDFSINAVMGIDSTPSLGVVVTSIFQATDGTMNVVLDGIDGSRPDRNPHVSGFTVEHLMSTTVPTMGQYALSILILLVLLGGLAGIRRLV